MKNTTRFVLIAATAAALCTVSAVSAAPRSNVNSNIGTVSAIPSVSVNAPVLKQTAADTQVHSAPFVCDATGNHAPDCNGTCQYSAVCDSNGTHAFNCNGTCQYSFSRNNDSHHPKSHSSGHHGKRHH